MYYFKSEEKWQKDLIKQLAEKYNLDTRVVRTLAYYPMLYLRDKMLESGDETPVRIRKLGVWAIKPRWAGKKT